MEIAFICKSLKCALQKNGMMAYLKLIRGNTAMCFLIPPRVLIMGLFPIIGTQMILPFEIPIFI